MSAHNPTRRDFIAETSKVALGAMILPRHILGGRGFQAPSATLNIAVVGAGGMGMSNMSRLLSENIVALCDVDFPYVERALEGRLRPRQGPQVDAAREAERMAESRKLQEIYTKATKYADFREMFDKQKDIDAVVIATPDHTHAIIANMAMKAGKHVYVQKPLTYSVHEARVLAATAKETGVVTEMGNQGHSMEGTRRIKELIASGILGPVREVHIWTDRPHRFWAQGIPRPGQDAGQQTAQQATQPAAATAPTPQPQQPAPPPRWSVRTVERAILKAMAENPQTPPQGLNWDLFLGPAKPIPYHPAYHPFSWRGWVDFGVSAIGDMGAHLIDQPYWALGLTYPTVVESSSTQWGGPPNDPASYPAAMTAKYLFPAQRAVGRTPGRPAVRMHWYDGGLMPPRPPFLPDDVTLPLGDGGGGVFIGDRGILVYETYGNNPKVYPEALAKRAERVPKTVPRIEVPHEVNWVQACKGETKASCPIEYAAPLTEVMLLGIVALRAGPGQKIVYDAQNMKVTNNAAADAHLTREYRAGWSL